MQMKKVLKCSLKFRKMELIQNIPLPGEHNDFSGPGSFSFIYDSDKMLSGCIYPQTEEDKIKLRDYMEDIFNCAADSMNHKLTLVRTGCIEGHCDYFNSVLEEMKGKYPFVEILHDAQVILKENGEVDHDATIDQIQKNFSIDVREVYNTFRNLFDDLRVVDRSGAPNGIDEIP